MQESKQTESTGELKLMRWRDRAMVTGIKRVNEKRKLFSHYFTVVIFESKKINNH